jgi:hypothetical protein
MDYPLSISKILQFAPFGRTAPLLIARISIRLHSGADERT